MSDVLSRLKEADRLTQGALTKLDAILERHWTEQAAKMRVRGMSEDQIEAAEELQNEMNAENRLKLAQEVWLKTLAILSVEAVRAEKEAGE